MHRRARGVPGALLAGGAIALAAVVPTAGRANHIPGATYTGTDERGGAVTLVVSADGSHVTEFAIHPCGEPFAISTQPAAIIDHAFSWEATPPHLYGSFLKGSFSDAQTAAGTLNMSNIFGCESGVLAWTARTQSQPPTPVPPATPLPTPNASCVVPNVIGKNLTRAKAMLREADCSAGRVRKKHSTAAARDRVLAQTPRPRTRLPQGGRVHLVVSLGRRQ